jgi:Flp pilus assembly protein TadG
MVRGGRERGSVTAEFAIALPVLVLVLLLGAGLLGATAARIRLEDATADAARLVARGEGGDRAAAVVARAVPGAGIDVDRGDEFVCVTASATVRVLGAAAAPVAATSCALAGGR